MRVGGCGASSMGTNFDAAPLMLSIGIMGGVGVGDVEPGLGGNRKEPFDGRSSDDDSRCSSGGTSLAEGTGFPMLTSPPILLISFNPRGSGLVIASLEPEGIGASFCF